MDQEPPSLTPEQAARVVTMRDLLAAIRGLAPEVRDYIADAIEPLARRIERMEATQLRYLGVWSAGSTYTAGAVVSHGGSAWHCNRETSDRPGSTTAWVLMVKHGRDVR